jgi:hypothetical protein
MTAKRGLHSTKDQALWQARYDRIYALWSELVPVMRRIRADHPECLRCDLGDIHASDGFSQAEDLVGNLLSGALFCYTRRPDPLAEKLLRERYAPRSFTILNQVKDMLAQYDAGEEPRRIADDLQAALEDVYQAAASSPTRSAAPRHR